MIKSSVERLSDVIGFEIGTSDDVTQIKLINGFCEGLANSCTSKQDLDTQLCYIAKGLNNKSEAVLSALVEFVKIKNEESVFK